MVIGNLGITLGRGFDIGSRTSAEVENIMTQVAETCNPISTELLDWLKQGAGKTKQAAYNYWLTLDTSVPKNKQVITRKAQHELFGIIYQHYVDETAGRDRTLNLN